jgi:hypothetical protein
MSLEKICLKNGDRLKELSVKVPKRLSLDTGTQNGFIALLDEEGVVETIQYCADNMC